MASAAFQTETRPLHLGPVPAGQSPYVYVPFEMPEGAVELTVRLDYDHAGGDNAIDFAIFDSAFSGRNGDLTGYRGKNPNREPLISVIGRTRASYGHVPGPMPAGTWRVMFYVYKTHPSGVDVTLRISIASEGGDQETASGPRWLRGDLHTHTLNSDGTWTVSALAAAAQQAGLDFLAITDHNVASHHYEIDSMPADGPFLLKGTEITTAGGHMNAWGLPTGAILEHRQLPGDDAAIQRAVAQAHALGARISINHPFADCKACGWAFDKHAANFDSIEVWNGHWGPEDQHALELWERLIRSGRRIAAIGSSDSHGPQNEVGAPTLYLYSALNPTALLSAITAGRAVITASPQIKLDMEAFAGDSKAGPGEEFPIAGDASAQLAIAVDGAPRGTLILFSEVGEIQRWSLTPPLSQQEIELRREPAFVRVEVRDEKGDMIAMSNPIWFRRR